MQAFLWCRRFTITGCYALAGRFRGTAAFVKNASIDGLWRSVLATAVIGIQGLIERPQSALMLGQVHRYRGTWKHAVNGYVALTNFAREKIHSGWIAGLDNPRKA